jgi:hypothetical protein
METSDSRLKGLLPGMDNGERIKWNKDRVKGKNKKPRDLWPETGAKTREER